MMKQSKQPLIERLKEARPVLLDGATGTELSRRGVNLNTPSWTAGVILDSPEVLLQVHRDYVDAGAEMITANTFRTHARNLKDLGPRPRDLAESLTHRAVELARKAAGTQNYVAGSIAPLEDCYSPELTPENHLLLQEHRQMAGFLADAGVDLILIETQITIREATIAARAAHETGIPYAVSFVCNSAGKLLSGESLVDAYREISDLDPTLFLVNCVPVEEVLSHLQLVLGSDIEIPVGAYANTGRLMANGSWEATQGELPAVYAEYVRSWIGADFRLIGGCCGTTPNHISAIHNCISGES